MSSGQASPDKEFERWYRSEHPRVAAALAVACGDVELAREATDEAFVRAYERWNRVRLMDSPNGWLYRVASNDLRRRFRRRTVERELLRRRRSSDGTEHPPPVADPRVWEAVRGLPKRQRSAVALRYVLDLTEREVAATMGISRGAVSAHLTSARKSLQVALAEPVTDDEDRSDSATDKPDWADVIGAGTNRPDEAVIDG